MSKNFNISATKITDLIRVSTAAIWYEHENRYQIETIIFSDEELHPAFKNNGESETIIDEEHKKRFIQMVYEFLKKNIEE